MEWTTTTTTATSFLLAALERSLSLTKTTHLFGEREIVRVCERNTIQQSYDLLSLCTQPNFTVVGCVCLPVCHLVAHSLTFAIVRPQRRRCRRACTTMTTIGYKQVRSSGHSLLLPLSMTRCEGKRAHLFARVSGASVRPAARQSHADPVGHLSSQVLTSIR